jgi:hypothetical protein
MQTIDVMHFLLSAIVYLTIVFEILPNQYSKARNELAKKYQTVLHSLLVKEAGKIHAYFIICSLSWYFHLQSSGKVISICFVTS